MQRCLVVLPFLGFRVPTVVSNVQDNAGGRFLGNSRAESNLKTDPDTRRFAHQ